MNKVPSNNNNSKKTAARIKEFLLRMAKIWLPVEERKKEKVVQGGKTKFPVTLLLAS